MNEAEGILLLLYVNKMYQVTEYINCSIVVQLNAINNLTVVSND